MGSVSIATYLCAIPLTIFFQRLWKMSLKFWPALPFHVYLEEFPIIISQSCFRRTIFPFLYWKGRVLSPAWLAHDSSMYSSVKINQKIAKKINYQSQCRILNIANWLTNIAFFFLILPLPFTQLCLKELEVVMKDNSSKSCEYVEPRLASFPLKFRKWL